MMEDKHMRIELKGNSLQDLSDRVASVENSIKDTIRVLKKQDEKLNNVNGGPNTATRKASTSLQHRIKKETEKVKSARSFANKARAFISDVNAIDKDVAKMIKTEQKSFYKNYPWLKPGNIIDDVKAWVKDFLKTTKEKLSQVWDAICEWLSDHWVELVVGTVAIAVAVVFTVLSGGSLTPLFLGVLKGVLISGGISGLIAGLTGGDIIKGILDGAASGYMFSGVVSALSSFVKYINVLNSTPLKSFSETFNSWDEMKEAHPGTITDYLNTYKPKGSPVPNNWFKKGGSLTIETLPNGYTTWTYKMKGDIVSYVPTLINGKVYNVIQFPKKTLYSAGKFKGSFTIPGGFTGDRAKDLAAAKEYLRLKYGWPDLPEGTVLHHCIEDGTFQLVKSKIHRLFSHYGGFYYNKL